MSRHIHCPMTLLFGIAVLFNILTCGDFSSAAEPTAEHMMRAAHQARALWNGMPGFTAEVSVSTNGDVVDGRMTVNSDGELKLESLESPHLEWAARRLQSLVDHRLPQADREYNVSFADDVTDHPLGRLIRFHEDRLHSVYRIKQDVITEVHRTMGATRFSITVTEIQRNAEGRHLPEAYTVSWWDVESGALTACDVIRNEWVRVGAFDLPARLLSVRSESNGQRDVGEIRIHNHRLLDKPAGN